jgi:hypothetical protein
MGLGIITGALSRSQVSTDSLFDGVLIEKKWEKYKSK